MAFKINETILTIAKQINAKELKFARFSLVADNDKNQVFVIKGKKGVDITYNADSDLYDVQTIKIKGFDRVVVDDLKGVYADQLKGIIQDFFPNFEYVMDSIRIVGVNC